MMGRQPPPQPKLFYPALNLERRIREDHILRKIAQLVDFDFIYQQVADTYGSNGNVSVPPPVILKMLLLLVLYNVRSERELMQTIPERLDWMWFLGYDLDDTIPNHSVLSKARARWGSEAFEAFFQHIVRQCVAAGLVDGRKIFVDASMVQADASNNSVVNQHSLKRYLNKGYRELERRLEQQPPAAAKCGQANRKHISTTDPDASVHRQGAGGSKLRYKVHRAVDERCEVITATEVSSGEKNEAQLLIPLIDAHQAHTGESVDTAVADTKYGTIDNYLACSDRQIAPHFRPFEQTHRGASKRKGLFAPSDFTYDASRDVFICPAGERLRRRTLIKARNHFEYGLSGKICGRCQLRPRCTRSKTGRTLKRHLRQDELDRMLAQSSSDAAKADLRLRQSLMERSFARSVRYGYQRARWRRLWRVKIQEYLTAAIQNILVLVGHVKEPRQAAAAKKAGPRPTTPHLHGHLTHLRAPQRSRLLFAALSAFKRVRPCFAHP